MAWSTPGIITNPAAGQIVADTGPLPATPFTLSWICWSTTACDITIHYRNAANTADIRSQKLNLSTFFVNAQIYSIPTPITLGLNERITLTVDSGFTGQIQCSLFTT